MCFRTFWTNLLLDCIKEIIGLYNHLKSPKKWKLNYQAVEHDRDIMEAADLIVDIGPKAGINGGEIVLKGTFQELLQSDSITGKYLSRELNISHSSIPRKGK